MTIDNASQMPRIFYARHMQPGVARYENETILVDGEGMKNLVASVGKRGIPVYINHQDVDLKNIKEQAAGYVTESFYNELDGWAWFKFIAVDDTAFEAIKKGWSVSNAYMPSEWGNGGTKNNVPYKREVRNGEFTHLAIVPDPRYENACIMNPEEFKNYQELHRKKLKEMQNSREKGKPMFKMFKTKKEEITNTADVDLDTTIELADGKSLSLRDMVEAVVENAKQEKAKIKVGDKDMTIEEVMTAYAEIANGKKKMKKNEKAEEDPDEIDEEGDQDDEGDDEIGADKMKNKKAKKNKKEKKNADDDEDCRNADDGDDDKKEKKNSVDEIEINDKFFDELRNAHLTAPKRQDNMPSVTISVDGIARGKSKYGTKDGTGRVTG